MIVSIISQGFVWAILGLGIFMTFRILNFPDMTTEGSFPLGGAVAVTLITKGVNPFLATLVAVEQVVWLEWQQAFFIQKGRSQPCSQGFW